MVELTLKKRILPGILAAAALLLKAGGAWSAGAADSCVECHRRIEGDLRGPSALFLEDVHFQRGLSCADCHGGDPAAADAQAAMDPAKGFVGRPARREIPQFCSRCHADPATMRRYNPNLPTDQYAKYLASQHGKRNFLGDPDTAVCTSCHEVHGIRSKKDPLSPVYPTNIPGTCAACHADSTVMDRHGLPVTQHWEYAQSVHGQALLFRGDRGAPHCASCHGSHEAARPGAIAVGNVCAQCHALTRDLFAKSPHKQAHERLGLPECEVCHGNHQILRPSDEMLGTGEGAVCVQCHEPGSKGFEAAGQMRASLEGLKQRMASAKAVVADAARLGMDVGDAEFELHEAEGNLTQARTYVHSFSAGMVEDLAKGGVEHAGRAEEQGRQAIKQHHFRWRGLWVTLAIIGLIVVALVFLIREIERDRPWK